MDNMLNAIEQGSTPGALPEGQRPAGLEAGSEARDLGPGEVEEMFGPTTTPGQRLERQGVEFVDSETEREEMI